MAKSDDPAPPWRIGVDVGGTFTDLVLVDGRGRIWHNKAPSNPSDPAVGVLKIIDLAAASIGISSDALLRGCSHFIHGTTIATNILLELSGASVGLMVTEGFRDTLEIRRGRRRDMWNHRAPWDDVIVPRYLRVPVRERIDARGNVCIPMDPESIDNALSRLERSKVEALAICFINSYANPIHERQCKEHVERLHKDLFVTTSSELVPVAGEFERCSTAVVNAYIAPKVIPYLGRLNGELRQKGLKDDVYLIQSSGSATSLADVRRKPAVLALSGPAAGVCAIKHFLGSLATENVISVEIGGTSCDVTLIRDGEAAEAQQLTIRDSYVALPNVEINTVGTGGGSIASIDRGGMLRVGPRGAGSTPGPACYGRGGQEPTLTDSHVVLGRLRAGAYANGSILIDHSLATASVTAKIADPLALPATAAASGIVALADQQIRHAVEKVSLERGFDPRDFTFVGAGGAGGLHVCSVARSLGCRKVFVPKLAGVFCALGMCNSDIRYDFVEAVGKTFIPRVWQLTADRIKAVQEEASRHLAERGFTADSISHRAQLELRYFGQQWTIRVPVMLADPFETILGTFESIYERQYAVTQDGAALELVNLTVASSGALPRLQSNSSPLVRNQPPPESTVILFQGGAKVEAACYEGAMLGPGDVIRGPAVINEATTTIILGKRDVASVDEYLNYQIELKYEQA